MSSTTVRISDSIRSKIKELSESQGISIQNVIEKAIDYYQKQLFLEELNKKGIKFILSYDGIRGNSSYLKDLPKHLYKRHMLLESGNSSFRKVMDKTCETVKESVYLNF